MVTFSALTKSLKPGTIHRQRGKPLGLPELVAIALGGMVGGGIFSVLGVSVGLIGIYTPVAIVVGGGAAALAAYSYVKLALYYEDEGATYSFFKRTFPRSRFAASIIGWWVVFGYISTLALYAFTFSSYAISGTGYADDVIVRKGLAGAVIAIFALINIWSVKGMGKLEDLIVYTKIVVLLIISFVLVRSGFEKLPIEVPGGQEATFFGVLMVASITFVAYEGFQLVIHATNEVDDPPRNIPRAIYTAIFIAILVYVVIAVGAILTIPFADIIRDKEYALASGAGQVLGDWGHRLVIFGALLATTSALSGTIFGSSRLVAVIAKDGFFPALLAKRRGHIPVPAILVMSACAFLLILSGGLQLILEFGSVTFLVVSLLMAVANWKIRDKTHSSGLLTLTSLIVLTLGACFIFYFEARHHPDQFLFIVGLLGLLSLGAWLFARRKPEGS